MLPLLEWTNGSLVGEHQWFPCWSGPMVPLLENTNGSLVGKHQWFLVREHQLFPCWSAPMVPLWILWQARHAASTIGHFRKILEIISPMETSCARGVPPA